MNKPVELVIDHSVQVDAFNRPDALIINSRKEFERNQERYEFLKWGQSAFENFRVVPPATGIVHQVNLEYLGRLVSGKTLSLEDRWGIQNDLFDLGADLCRPDMARDAGAEYPPLRMTGAQVERLEGEIDAMNADLEPLRSFILPGGSPLAAYLHLCRTVSRRAERQSVELATMEAVNPAAVKYLNRLSDWFFVAGRIANDDG